MNKYSLVDRRTMFLLLSICMSRLQCIQRIPICMKRKLLSYKYISKNCKSKDITFLGVGAWIYLGLLPLCLRFVLLPNFRIKFHKLLRLLMITNKHREIAKRCPEYILSVVEVSSCSYQKTVLSFVRN